MTQKTGKADKWFDQENNEWKDTDENGNKLWDTDGDGIPDAKDEDKDEKADKWKEPEESEWKDAESSGKGNGKDTDGDGQIDTWYDEEGNETARDTDGDGKADRWKDENGEWKNAEESGKGNGKDTTGDGKIDTWYDDNGNETSKDTNGDGKADKFKEDPTDPNSKWTEGGTDKNGGKDTTGDGKVDTWDTDGDGEDDAKDENGDGKADKWKDPSVPGNDWKDTDEEGNKQWDTDGDGKPDAKDTDDDNNADQWIDPNKPDDEWKGAEASGKGNGKDTDGDGKVDTWYDDSGKKETAWDTDGDEKADSFDTDGDGELDDEENASIHPDLNGRDKNGGKDTNGDGKPDTWDTNGDGKDDSWDTNGDGNADSFDKNGNGELDDDENSTKTPSNNGKDENGGKDTNGDGKPDIWYDENGKEIGKDEDGDGKADKFIDPETQDPNGEGKLSDKDRNENKLFDTDGDGKPDARDTNNDGKADEWKDPETGEWKSSNELPGKPKDTDSDGIPDEWDFNEDNKTDAWDKNGDGKPDQWDTNKDGNVDAWDTDGDGMPDSYDTTKDGSADTWVPSAKEGSIEFTYKPTGWTKEEVEVTLSSDYTKNGFEIQYSTDYNELTRDGKWEDGTTVTLKDNGPIYARLKSTKNEDIGGIIKGEVNKIDKVAPTVTVNILEQTTSTIKVKTDVEDKASGLPNPVTYNYYIKEKDGSEDYKLKGTQTVPARLDVKTSTDTFTFTKLTQTTDYDIKVTVEDLVKNEGQGTAQGTTNTVPSGQENIEFGDVQWDPDNNQASVQVSTTTNYKIRYWTSVDAENEEHKVIETGGKITVNQNKTTIYAELWDETNASTVAKSLTIDDTQKPTMTIKSTITTTRDITITANAEDYQFGMPKTPTYNFYIIDQNTGTYPTTPTGTSEDGTYKYTEAVHNTTYKIKVEVSDFAGNKETQETTAKTQEMPSAKDEQNGLTIAEPQWNSSAHNASVKINKRNEKDGYILQYKTGNEWESVGSAETSSHTVTVSNDTTVYARLFDGKNAGVETSKLVKDEIAPTVTVNCDQNTITSHSISITASAEDTESGMETKPTYSYYISETDNNWNKVTGTNDTGTYTFDDLKQKTKYYIRVEVADYVQNMGNKSISATTLTIPTGVDGLSFGDVSWKEGKANITVSKKSGNDAYIIQYSIDGQKYDSENSATVPTHTFSNIDNNTTVYARLTDGKGKNFGDPALSKLIKDENPPEVQQANQETTNWAQSKRITVSATDGETGIAAYAITNGTSQPGANSDEWQISSSNSWTSTKYYGKGTYYAWVKDKAGNISTSGRQVDVNNIDTTDPTITVEGNTKSTPAKSQEAIITINDAGGSGLQKGQYNINYVVSQNETVTNYNVKNTQITVGGDGVVNSASTRVTMNDSSYTGTYYLHVQGVDIKDNAGNVFSPTNKNSFVFDNSGPTISFDPESNENWANKQSSTITVKGNGPATEDTSTYKYAWVKQNTKTAPDSDGSYTTQYNSGEKVEKTLDTGNNWYLIAMAKDSAGNVTRQAAGPFYLDNTRPTITSATEDPANWQNKDKSIKIAASDGESGIGSYAITDSNVNTAPAEGSAWTQASGTTWTSSGTYGKGNYNVWVKDKAGNVVEAPRLVTISNIDTELPTIEVSGGTATPAKSQEAKITIKDTGGSGLANATYTINYTVSKNSSVTNYKEKTATIKVNNGESSASTTVTLNDSSYTGIYYLHVQGESIRDNAGNSTSPTNRNTFNLDNTGPDITFTPDGKTTYAKSYETTINVNDSSKGASTLKESSLKYVWQQGNNTNPPGDNSFSGSYTNGGKITSTANVTGNNWYLWAMATDSAGNTTKKCSAAFCLDNNPPSSAAPTGRVTSSSSIIVSSNQNDGESGLDTKTRKYGIKKSSSSAYEWITDPNPSHTFTGLDMKTEYKFVTQIADLASNGPTTSGEITITTNDITAPTVTTNNTGWTGGDVDVNINFPNSSGLTKQYQESTGGEWKVANSDNVTVKVKTNNTTVSAKQFDTANNKNMRAASYTVKNIDKEIPNQATIQLSAKTGDEGGKITATVTQSDNLSDVEISKCKWVFNTTPGTSLGETAYVNAGFTTKTNNQIQLDLSSAGTYYLHVLTVDKVGNKKESVSDAITVTKKAKTAADLANLVNGQDANGTGSIIGSKVIGVELSDSISEEYNWTLFDVADNHIWLIADRCVKLEDCPQPMVTSGAKVTQSSYNGKERYLNLSVGGRYGSGLGTVANDDIKKLHSKYFEKGYAVGSPAQKGSTAAYVLDSDLWTEKFTGNKAGTSKIKYVIGSPTIEQIVNVYNKRDKKNLSVEVADINGYTVNSLPDTGVMNICPTVNEPWYIATPFKTESQYPISEWYIDQLNSRVYWYSYAYACVSLRPCICLTSDTAIEKQSDGSYKIEGYELGKASDFSSKVNGQDANGTGSIIGSKVTGVGLSDSISEEYNWTLFDVANNHIWLIADRCVKLEDCPQPMVTSGAKVTQSSYNGKERYLNLSVGGRYGSGLGTVANDDIKKLHSKYFEKGYAVGSPAQKGSTAAYVLDSDLWTEKFTGNKAGTSKIKYVIGSPTIEQIVNVYNKRDKKNLSVEVADINGYTVNSLPDTGVMNICPTVNEPWYIATPFKTESQYPISEWYIDQLNSRVYWYSYAYACVSLRPCICLTSDTILAGKSDGSYKIVN